MKAAIFSTKSTWASTILRIHSNSRAALNHWLPYYY
jgi:hypothetical protein